MKASYRVVSAGEPPVTVSRGYIVVMTDREAELLSHFEVIEPGENEERDTVLCALSDVIKAAAPR